MQRVTNISIVNLHGSDRPQYRLGDAVLMRDHRYGRLALAMAASDDSPFEGSLLHSYAGRIDVDSADPQWHVLRDLVAERNERLPIPGPAEDELVVHLRLGDTKGFTQPAETLVDYVSALARRERVGSLTIVTAVHFGALFVNRHRDSGRVDSEIAAADTLVARIVDRLRATPLPVRLHSHDDVDRDFCYLVGAHRLVLGNGHFSLCAAMVSQGEVFVPPWARSGTDLDIDALLRTRKQP